MACYSELSVEELSALKESLQAEYEEIKSCGLKLDMSRGKPSAAQLDLSMDLLNCLTEEDIKSVTPDVRNYGLLEGLPGMRKLFADMLGLKPEEIFVGGNSSLNLMYDTLAKGMLFGYYNSEKPWGQCGKIKFLCPAPGYDRHFGVTQTLGIEMVTVPMTPTGPDMDIVEELVQNDASIKGIWCVPMYSNPDGITYSDEKVRRFANLKPAAKDFRIFWDNAYCVHHVSDQHDELLNLMDECRKAGTEDSVFMFASTSKVTFSGAGVAAFGCSENNMKHLVKLISMQTIGLDKVNQLRHLKYFKDLDGVKAHMEKHCALMKPKFETVLRHLDEEIAPLGIAEWQRPNGGYFISLNVMSGCAKQVVALCKEAGVVLTPAGATFPYGVDPLDRNIRIAPSFPTAEELEMATKVLCLSVKLASVQKLLAQKKTVDGEKDATVVA